MPFLKFLVRFDQGMSPLSPGCEAGALTTMRPLPFIDRATAKYNLKQSTLRFLINGGGVIIVGGSENFRKI